MSAPTPPAGLSITVYGGPAPQGSKRYLGAPGGKGRMIEMSKRVAPWRSAVVDAARTVIDSTGAVPLDGPLAVRMIFTLRKPASAPKRRRTWPDRTPDLSKLARSTEDALTDAGAIVDDARIVEYLRLAKVYPGEDPDALDIPGARIWIGPVLPDAEVTLTARWAHPLGEAMATHLATDNTDAEVQPFNLQPRLGAAINQLAAGVQAAADFDRANRDLAATLAADHTTVLAEIDQAQQEVRADG
jgi:Holliday junction resolvase RusA-like endonuclease